MKITITSLETGNKKVFTNVYKISYYRRNRNTIFIRCPSDTLARPITLRNNDILIEDNFI